jgi:hypothetical protein
MATFQALTRELRYFVLHLIAIAAATVASSEK